jgi:hypothetical protein
LAQQKGFSGSTSSPQAEKLFEFFLYIVTFTKHLANQHSAYTDGL